MAQHPTDRNDGDTRDNASGASSGAEPGLVPGLYLLGLVNLFWSMVLIQASLGWPAVLALAVFLDYLITRLDRHRRRAAADGIGLSGPDKPGR